MPAPPLFVRCDVRMLGFVRMKDASLEFIDPLPRHTSRSDAQQCARTGVCGRAGATWGYSGAPPPKRLKAEIPSAACEPKVSDLRHEVAVALATTSHEHVVTLQVVMEDGSLVQVRHAANDASQQGELRVGALSDWGVGLLIEKATQRPANHQLHHQRDPLGVIDANPVDLHDIGVGQLVERQVLTLQHGLDNDALGRDLAT